MNIQTLEQYRLYEYPNICNPSKFGYSDSSSFLSTSSYILSVFIIPSNLYGCYCIVYESPPKMNHVKSTFLNLQIWSGLVDLCATLLFVPYLFLPVFAGFPVGLFSLFGLNPIAQVFIGQAAIGGLSVSHVFMFENRHNAVATGKLKLEKKNLRKLFYALHFLFGFAFLAPTYFHIPDQESAKLTIVRTVLQCPTPEFFRANVFVFTLDLTMVYYLTLFFLAVLIVESIFFTCHALYCLYVQATHLSSTTKALQKEFLLRVCIQIFLPAVVLLFPIVWLLSTNGFLVYNQTINNIWMLIFSLHGVFVTICLIVMNEPYRVFTKCLILRQKREDKNKPAMNTDVCHICVT